MKTTPRAVDLVLFDLDGTLVDHDTASATAVERWLLAQGWAEPVQIAAHAEAWEAIAERHFPAYRSGELGFHEMRRRRVRDFLPRLGIDTTGWGEAAVDEAFAGYLAEYEAAWTAFPDAAGCLQALQGVVVRTAVLSNGDQTQQADKLARTGLAPLLDAVLTSGGLGVAKPDPEAFRGACSRLGVAPERAMYVGDRLDVDAHASLAAGLRGVWLDRRGAGTTADVERLTSLAELPPMLANVRESW